MNNLGELIKQKRLEKGLTIEQLSEKTMLSIAILKDIESGAFNRYEGDEMYVRMYLRKLCKVLDMDVDEVTASYLALTEEIKKEELEKAAKAVEAQKEKVQNKNNFQFERPNYNGKNNVYRDKSHLKFIRAGIICVVVALIVAVAYTAIKSLPAGSSSESTQQSTTGSVKTTKKKETKKKETAPVKEEKEEKKEATVSFKSLSSSTRYPMYQVNVSGETDKITVKVVFGKKSWAGFYVNGVASSKFENRTYKAGETVTAKLNAAKFKKLKIVNGRSTDTKYYINDKEVPLTNAQKNAKTSTLTIVKKN
ncbi:MULTISPECIES: helix-turn-helix domain-containing protein [Kandleria]|jgi:cytoskeletal protein RodZ|uniref:HTH cro/C1-type domain-containing protein n=1 Tax=Kandleria vitulina DSM 20405 TaxID=1410657 RepID=A0A0R2HCV8_9FIRM|nr:MULTISPECIES: helix-turn-helix domain-containing protein [Kandleria]KRN50802.1 hypothetical protein IV49_GL001618 [Kandleria vitulina DSM 20405]MBP3277114.1 helix-turn-helix domain-containing protein [Kandleria sp.]HCJ15089.1 transcriptional regulator [Erysipelotrichaceae bacterium]